MNYYKSPYVDLRLGDSRDVVKDIDANSIQTVVTSPPYWGLRDYHTDNQIGLEQRPDEYIENLVELFSSIRSILHPSGTVWLNLGDSYHNYRSTAIDNRKQTLAKTRQDRPDRSPHRSNRIEGLKSKDLVGMPWRTAFALQSDGWYLRSDIIWSKPNPMPESVKDRPTKSHEYIFLLSKSMNYYYDHDAIKEPTTTYEMRNKRSVWEVNTYPYPKAHFATYPERLVEPCILAGAKPGDTVLDPFIGSGTTCAVAQRLGRQSIGIDSSEEYLQLAKARIENIAIPMF